MMPDPEEIKDSDSAIRPKDTVMDTFERAMRKSGNELTRVIVLGLDDEDYTHIFSNARSHAEFAGLLWLALESNEDQESK